MRRCDIIFGILLVISIIDFALAAPVSVQEKVQERVDVVHIPKDVITVLTKRWEEDSEELGEEYLKTGEKPVESSDSTLSSNSAPSGPDHGSTNAVQPPAPNPASSTANPDPLMKPSSYSSSASLTQHLRARGNYMGKLLSSIWSHLHADDYIYDLAPAEYGLDHELTGAHRSRPNPNPNSRPHPSADPNFDWDYWMSLDDPPPRPVSSKELDQAHKNQVDSLNSPSTSGSKPSPPEPKPEVVTPSPPSLSADSQPVDPLAAALYAAKGKAKVLRRISGTARDVGNAAQRELQPGERPLDQVE